MRTPDSPSPSFTTLTHARLRALQGDYAAAERLLVELLEEQPDHAEARALLRSVAGRIPIDSPQPGRETPELRQPGDPGRLAGAFREALGAEASPAVRIRRLEDWLSRIRRSR